MYFLVEALSSVVRSSHVHVVGLGNLSFHSRMWERTAKHLLGAPLLGRRIWRPLGDGCRYRVSSRII
jgi:hypothetical protein